MPPHADFTTFDYPRLICAAALASIQRLYKRQFPPTALETLLTEGGYSMAQVEEYSVPMEEELVASMQLVLKAQGHQLDAGMARKHQH